MPRAPLSLSHQLTLLLEKGKFAQAEKLWSKGARWGEPIKDIKGDPRTRHPVPHAKLPTDQEFFFDHDRLWITAACRQPATRVWDFLASHQAPCFTDRSPELAAHQLFETALIHGRLDLADWLEERGHTIDKHRPPPQFLLSMSKKVASASLAEVWHWVIARHSVLSPASDGHSAHADDLLRLSLEPAMANAGFISVVKQLLEAGADVKTALPPDHSSSLIGIPSASALAAQSGGTALHTLAHIGASQFNQRHLHDRAKTEESLARLWDLLISHGADPQQLSPDGLTASQIIATESPELFEARNIRLGALHRAATTQGVSAEEASVSRRARLRS